MPFTLIDFYSFSIGFAAIIGAVRFGRIHPGFRPFIYLCWIGFAQEAITYYQVYHDLTNEVNINIYYFLEAMIITWQMHNWQVWTKPNWLLPVIAVTWTIGWSAEMLFFDGFGNTISFFRIISSFVIVLMAINGLGQQLGRERTNLLKNSIVLIELVFIIYFTYTVVIGVFWMNGFSGSMTFQASMVWILIYINFFSNLVYALAVLWMPKKLRFSLPY